MVLIKCFQIVDLIKMNNFLFCNCAPDQFSTDSALQSPPLEQLHTGFVWTRLYTNFLHIYNVEHVGVLT